MSDQSILAALSQLQSGSDEAAQRVWEDYFPKLVRLAASRLRSIPRRSADEEDVALSAMNSFMNGVRDRRFENISSRDELWKLLVTITIRKANAAQRRHHAQKRGGGMVRGESVFVTGGPADDGGPGLAGESADEPTPSLVAELAENVEQLLSHLDEARLRGIAIMRLEGYSNEEIAARANKSVATVERKLNLIRKIWSARETYLD